MITYILLGGNLDLHLATFLYLVTMAAFTLVLSILIVLSGFRIFLVVKVGSTLYFLLLVFLCVYTPLYLVYISCNPGDQQYGVYISH